eukprot:jgi/Mesvir1/2356/Mv06737-RA.1
MLHSGSRHIGNKTASYYDRLAVQQMADDGRSPPGQRSDINSLRIDSDEGRDYLADMQWCQAYALENRRAMLAQMAHAAATAFGHGIEDDRVINAHHNFCRCERCRYTDPATGKEVEEELWVTRKGATSARPGEFGLIPGSMATGSYVVTGKGDPRAWYSCSHGAGRRLSRTAAFASITQQEFEAALAGVVCDTNEGLRDEAPQAYKDLTVVMANQANLVSIEHRLLPLLNVKGFEKVPRQMKKAEARTVDIEGFGGRKKTNPNGIDR